MQNNNFHRLVKWNVKLLTLISHQICWLYTYSTNIIPGQAQGHELLYSLQILSHSLLLTCNSCPQSDWLCRRTISNSSGGKHCELVVRIWIQSRNSIPLPSLDNHRGRLSGQIVRDRVRSDDSVWNGWWQPRQYDKPRTNHISNQVKGSTCRYWN